MEHEIDLSYTTKTHSISELEFLVPYLVQHKGSKIKRIAILMSRQPENIMYIEKNIGFSWGTYDTLKTNYLMIGKVALDIRISGLKEL